MAEGFYGRIKAYEDGLDGEDAVLEAALSRNLFGTARADSGQVGRIAAYVRRETAQLAGQPAAALLAGDVVFGGP